ncbi:MAG: UDP-glucose 4-epimerase GalE, partial [Deltaproteobacteria bacterium]|nr:UDP-glucose 4-epimerase GalE [Deltaproteobacteria bacterium]
MYKNILVVGGAGYIGSHVVLAFLEEGYHVSVLDNLSTGLEQNLFPEADFFHGDIIDKAYLRQVFKNKFDGVIHLAALKAAGDSMLIPEKYAYQNISGTLNLVEAVTESKTNNIIFSSTAAVYGLPEYLPLDEEHPLVPINFYGYTKRVIEQYLGWFDRLKGLKSVCLRYFNAAGYDLKGRVTGIEIKPANLIPIVMEAAIGMRQSVEVFGQDYQTRDGTGERDYIHVSDLASAHLKAYENLAKDKTSLILNLGTEKTYSVLDVINLTEKISGRKIPFNIA